MLDLFEDGNVSAVTSVVGIGPRLFQQLININLLWRATVRQVFDVARLGVTAGFVAASLPPCRDCGETLVISTAAKIRAWG